MATTATPYPKRLIEVDLPIRRISAHARREKSIRHGHISTLHIWWARRPLAACRAVICAALWPDPADPLCPAAFRETAHVQMRQWADRSRHLVSAESLPRIEATRNIPTYLDAAENLRAALLDFIADFANWDNSTNPAYLDTARALTQSAHEALGGEPGTRPLVVDPFAGGGAIPLEALRVGADAFASDLNPVAVLLNKVVLEYIPKYGQRLADEVRKWGQWIKEQAEQELAEFYPKDPDGATPIAYLWARTIRCEGPGCGAEVPLIRSLWLVRKRHKSQALKIIPNRVDRSIDFEIIQEATAREVGDGTIRKGAVTCPVCSFTTPVASVRRQLAARNGGTHDARLLCVVFAATGSDDRFYRLPRPQDLQALTLANVKLVRLDCEHPSGLSLVPKEPLPLQGTLGFRVQLYGMRKWGDLFTSRQLLALTTLAKYVCAVHAKIALESDAELADVVQTCLALTLDKQADYLSSLCTWHYHDREKVNHTFARQALPFVSDFVEATFFGSGSGNWSGLLDWTIMAVSASAAITVGGSTAQAAAFEHPLPNDSASGFITDPPYYDAVPYADLSDFFYVWLRRTLPSTVASSYFTTELTPKAAECIVDQVSGKDQAFFEQTMTRCMTEGRRLLAPGGIGVLVFAHKSTSGWEAQLQAMVDAGWIVSGSWPIDTEMGTRLRAHDSAALASSIHLICRPRDTSSTHAIGDWRDVLAELPQRIHAWMPRLVSEGIVGADAIFACLGPAVEIFSRYERVERADGTVVTLREYLSHVWGAVAHEALWTILDGDSASELEEDARLTAIWFWTMKAAANGSLAESVASIQAEEFEEGDTDDDNDGDEEGSTPLKAVRKSQGYAMEFDAARKLAQGLGADLSKLSRPGGIVSIVGSIATLHTVSSREQYLTGVQLSLFDASESMRARPSRSSFREPHEARLHAVVVRQSHLFAEEHPVPTRSDQPPLPLFEGQADQRTLMDRLMDSGKTTLDRLHQSMLLFARSQTGLLAQFLTETQMGTNPHFWRLAQALSALYPMGSDEKRWVDGVLARKKGWGM